MGGGPRPAARPEAAEPNGPLPVAGRLAIPRAELDAKATRSGGPGGQHVNTSSTRIELRWNVRTSTALDDAQRARLLEKLASRLDAEGWVRVVSSEHRSQLRNREAAEARLAMLVREALVVPKARRATKPTRASVARRLDGKKRQSEKKAGRRGRIDD
jgi:ribosome-associated protein